MRLNQQGFSLIQVLIVVALMGVVAVGMMTLFGNMQTQWRRNAAFANIEGMRARLATFMVRYDSRARTLADANNFQVNCDAQSPKFPNPFSCGGPLTGGLLRLVDAQGQVVHDSFTPETGFTEGGLPCDTFDATHGNDACPFRVELYWSAACRPSGAGSVTCPNPHVYLSGRFLYSPQNFAFGPLNMLKWDFTEADFGAELPDVNCKRMGGTWEPNTDPSSAGVGECHFDSRNIEWF